MRPLIQLLMLKLWIEPIMRATPPMHPRLVYYSARRRELLAIVNVYWKNYV